ncbi:MAG: hybrid sensor histidine kinase/response regulator [Anaerolineaceae bacterium]|nr:hybrid sensor histidine kinase/response regulator [Anaerolineaceae bacterium]
MNQGNALKKILVVEDEQSLRNDIIEMLSYEGFTVIGAENGRVGIEQARENLPDLIICDIMMPEVDGYAVLEELRKETRTAAIPFIFLTARTDKLDRRHGMEQGADDYLTKPFAVKELLKTIETRLLKREMVKQDAERRNEALRNNIILSMPHELRTPLTVILGFSDILITDHSEMEPARIGEMAQHINKAALRLYHLVENYLVYAQIEIAINDAGFTETVKSNITTDPKIVIENQAIQKAQEHDREADLQLEVSELDSVQILEDYLKKIVEELIDNAFKFSEHGQVVRAVVTQEDNKVFIRVTDQGRGMTSEQIDDVGAYMQFNRRFYEQQGSGLGLTIAKRIAEIHGGELSIDSVPNQQTTVTIVLPLADKAT